MKQKNENPEHDDSLADFTNRVLAGKSDRPDSKADDELQGLEATILRLNRALPNTDVDKVSLKHLEARLKARLQRKQEQARLPFWKKLFGWKYGQFRTQGFVAAVLVMLTLVAFLIAILFPLNASAVTATAFIGSNTFITLTLLAGAILVAIWISRRK